MGLVELMKYMSTATTLDKDLFISFALEKIRAFGYKLLATVPLARRKPLGMGSKRKVWVFQDMMYHKSEPPTLAAGSSRGTSTTLTAKVVSLFLYYKLPGCL